MDFLHIAILGLIQGITEFLPVSSSGHLVLAPKFFHWQDHGLDIDAFLHLGTLAAILIYFRKDIVDLLTRKHKLALGIALATLPAVAIGFTFKNFFASGSIRSVEFIAFTLVFGALLMLGADFYYQKLEEHSQKIFVQIKKFIGLDTGGSIKKIRQLNTLEVFFIGCMQALALFPGVSRSGITIAASLFTGLNREESAKFAFMLGIPAIAGAGLLSVLDLVKHSQTTGEALNLPVLMIGFIVSAVSGYLAIGFLIKYLKSNSLLAFVIYRMILALLLLL